MKKDGVQHEMSLFEIKRYKKNICKSDCKAEVDHMFENKSSLVAQKTNRILVLGDFRSSNRRHPKMET